MPRAYGNRGSQGSPDYASILRAIKNPLTFFGLALLIVEAFIYLIILCAGFSPAVKLGLTITGIGLFVGLCAAVFVLVWYKPEELMSDKDAYMTSPEIRREGR